MSLILALVLGVGAGTSATADDSGADGGAAASRETALTAVAARLTRHIGELSSRGSRMTGYPGATAAASYLVRELESLGGMTEVFRHPFHVAVPIDEGAGMSLDGRRLLLHCVWPNLVRTPTLPDEGIVGMLVYGGRAERFELDGPHLQDAVVVLEYDCGMNWVTAFDLGAAAVIFLSPEADPGLAAANRSELARAHRQEGAQKFLTTPADLPRFYAPPITADILRRRLREEAPATVRLWGRMTWRQARAETVVAVFPGTDPDFAGGAMMIGAYYDAISPVPAATPGADQASGVATWLELARLLAIHPPRQTVALAATPGHFQALAGMREVVARMRPAPDAAGQGRRPAGEAGTEVLGDRLAKLQIDLFLGLDLSSHSRRLALVHAGTPHRVRKIRLPLFEAVEAFAQSYEADALGGRMILGGDLRPLRQRRLVGRLPERIPLQGAVVSLAGMPGLTLVTAGDERRAFDSPLDKPEFVDIGSLAEQAHFISALVAQLTQTPPAAPEEPAKDSFARLRGRVVSGEGERSYEPDHPIAGALVRVRSLHKNLMGVRADPMAFTDSAGAFELTGIEAKTLYLKPIQLEAYKLDAGSGRITHVLDRGPYGVQQRPNEILMDQLQEERTLVVFPCSGLTLFDLFDPRTLATLSHVRLLDAAREADPVHYGYCMPITVAEVDRDGYFHSAGSATEQVAVAFAAQGTALKLTMAADRFGLGRRLVLLNSGAGDPAGVGYRPPTTPRLRGTALRVATDMWRLDEFRLAGLERHGIESAVLRRLHNEAEAEIQRGEAHARAGEHTRFLDRSRRAWALAAEAYSAIEEVGTDAVRGVLFFLFLVLPFSVLGERLLFAGATVRLQVGGAVAIFLAAFLVLRLSHPAFELTIYPIIVLVGFLSLALSMVVIWIGLSRLNAQLHESVSRRVAVHRADTRRSAILARSLLLGVAQMRRRPWRTGLTCTTLALLTFSLVSFTSVRSSVRYNRTPLGPVPEAADALPAVAQNPPREPVHGLLVRRPEWEGLEAKTADFLRTRFAGELVLERFWYSRPGVLVSEGASQRVEGALGLSAEEPELTPVGETLVAGRWFAAGESDACILPEGLARALGIDLSAVGEEKERVGFLGAEYRVVGVVDADRFEAIRDVHGGPITPVDMETDQAREHRVGLSRHGVDPIFTHVGAGQIVLLPGRVVSRWGEYSRLASVAVVFRGTAEEAEVAIHDFASALGINLTALTGGQRYLINTVGVRTFGGRAGVFVPLIIAALIVFNTMLGTVHERLGEIGILNAVGLAPAHVTGLFMAEAGTYAILSAVLGYLAAQVLARVGWVHGLFPGLTVNFSSYSAVVTIAVVMAVVLLSALYPAHRAGRICLPGIERTWQLPEAQGDHLFLPMPFTLQGPEARQLLSFMSEYLEAYDEQSIGAGFYAEGVLLAAGASEATVWLAPFDQGVSQRLRLDLTPEGDDRFFSLRIHIERQSGERSAWLRANRLFIDRLRKQFLVWRALSDADRRAYT